MITILIVGSLLYLGYGWYRYKKDGCFLGAVESRVPGCIVIGMVLFAALGFLSSTFIGTNAEDYASVENYLYVTEDGVIKMVEGNFYVKDDVYYELHQKGVWIPFYPNEYIEADLPKNYLPELIGKK